MIKRILGSVVVALLLAGCSGGGDPAPTTTPDAPAASATVAPDATGTPAPAETPMDK